MIVIGADIHKRTHALAAVQDGTGAIVGEQAITADEQGHLAALRWAKGLDGERVWALEDCRQVSRRLEQALLAAGERVVRVPPRMMGASRRGERVPGKSDQIDARAVARAVIRDGLQRFPPAFLDETAMEIRLLADYREGLVAERTRAQNRLRWHLVDLCPDLEAQIRVRSLSSEVHLDRIAKRLRGMGDSIRVRVARNLLAHIRRLVKEARALERELRELVLAHRPQLLDQTGCGTLTAAILIARTAGVQRFRTDGQFARMAGVAPIPASSGSTTGRHRLHRGGDRQLNRALHMIAITRARLDPETRAYLDRKRREGKSTSEALRCLKRHLARRFHKLLQPPRTTPPTPQNDTMTGRSI